MLPCLLEGQQCRRIFKATLSVFKYFYDVLNINSNAAHQVVENKSKTLICNLNDADKTLTKHSTINTVIAKYISNPFLSFVGFFTYLLKRKRCKHFRNKQYFKQIF